jgi:hypothetical protein
MYKPSFLSSFYRIFCFSKIQILFIEALALVRNFKMVKFLHILEEQNPQKIKKIWLPKNKFKWPLNSRWLPKLNLLVKTTNHLFTK